MQKIFLYIAAFIFCLNTSSCSADTRSGSKQNNTQNSENTSASGSSNTSASDKQYTYQIKSQAPHATNSYTQGLQIVDGEMWEATGLYGESRLMNVNRTSGATELIAALDEKYFGEGLCILGDTIFWITWRENTLFMYDKKTKQEIGKKTYAGEGWGLTSDGSKLYMSDGSNKIFVRDPKTFDIVEQHEIMYKDKQLHYINEMEWIKGKIWANIYTTDYIVIIDPQTWKVDKLIDLTGILPESERTDQTDVLNGIAYDEEQDKIYVTGKNWSRIYEIEVIEK